MLKTLIRCGLNGKVYSRVEPYPRIVVAIHDDFKWFMAGLASGGFIEFTIGSCQLIWARGGEKKEAQAGLLSVLQCNPLPGKLRPEADVARGLPQVGLAVQVVLN